MTYSYHSRETHGMLPSLWGSPGLRVMLVTCRHGQRLRTAFALKLPPQAAEESLHCLLLRYVIMVQASFSYTATCASPCVTDIALFARTAVILVDLAVFYGGALQSQQREPILAYCSLEVATKQLQLMHSDTACKNCRQLVTSIVECLPGCMCSRQSRSSCRRRSWVCRRAAALGRPSSAPRCDR